MYKKGSKIKYTEKECKICHIIKPISDFYSRTDKTCKKCRCNINSEKSFKIHLNNYPDLPNEIWEEVYGYESYYKVSNLGRIRSLIKGRKNGCILQQSSTKQGYKRIKLSNKIASKSYLVHRIVAIAFIPNPDNKETINHKDGNKQNNNISNLEWATQSENNKHAFKTGLKSFTYKNMIASTKGRKLSENQVENIRNKSHDGYSISDLSKMFFVSKSQICRIINKKSRIPIKQLKSETL